MPLTPEDLRHAADSLRLRPGEEIVGVDPRGNAAVYVLTSVHREGVEARWEADVERPWEPDVTLVLGIAKGAKFDDAVEGAIEVGVRAVWPVMLTRDIVKLEARKREARAERWRRVALAAAKQSQRAFVPEVAEPATLRDLLPMLAGLDVVLVAWEEALSHPEAPTVGGALRAAGASADSSVAVVVGSEGGLTGAEVASLREIGAIAVTLGPTILRTETAGVVAPALVIAEMHELHRGEDR
ncbi:MAG: 16S rRNA (uracil(1498)-N(3))-methyltransferase [Coriobacteriales bacterium]|nr:16S rRNA (uracil(1498)-N(3))-methyltransferase [Coriobacteriales bacterium]